MDVLHSLNGLEMMSRSKMVHYRAEQEEYIMTVSSMLKHFERVISQTIMKTLCVAIDNFEKLFSNSILAIQLNSRHTISVCLIRHIYLYVIDEFSFM